MPLSSPTPDAVAKTYARSLFELAEAEGGRDALEDTLGELEDILEIARDDADFSEFLASRAIQADRRAESLSRIFDGRINPLTLRFLLLLNEKDRLAHLPAVATAYDQIVQAHFGRIEVDVYTASPLSADDQRQLRERIEKILSKSVVLHPYTDDRMIGGIRIRIGDTMVDASLSTQIRRLREQFADRGTAAIRARAKQAILDSDNGQA